MKDDVLIPIYVLYKIRITANEFYFFLFSKILLRVFSATRGLLCITLFLNTYFDKENTQHLVLLSGKISKLNSIVALRLKVITFRVLELKIMSI